jgi:spermidine synthase
VREAGANRGAAEQAEPRARIWPALAAASLLSGCAALVYQILWTRRFALVLGGTLPAVTTVVATFMAGLGLGSAIAARLVDRQNFRRLAGVYALLECGIAAWALLLPALLATARPSLAAVYASGGGSPAALAAARIGISALLLLVPTTLMGATLPVLTALASPAPGRLGGVAGRLYAWNAFGAAAGSLAGALLLLPGLGAFRSTLAAIGLNLLAAAAVFFRLRRAPEPDAARVDDARAAETPKKRAKAHKRLGDAAPRQTTLETLPAWLTLAAVTLSGFAALSNEVGWTRALVLLIGPTSYAFAFILTTVIAAIALGSALASRLLDRGAPAPALLAGALLAAALTCFVPIAAIGRAIVPFGALVRENAERVPRLLAYEFGIVAALLLLPAALCGAVFPPAVASLAARRRTAAGATGLVYAWNTLGAIAGAAVCGFLMLPAIGLEWSLYAGAAVLGAASALVSLFREPNLRARALALLALGAPIAAPFLIGRWDRELLAGGVYKYAAYAHEGAVEDALRAGELVYYKEGRAATVSAKRLGGTLSLAIDGKVDATSSGDMLTQRLLAHVPLLLHPSPKRALVIGLGSGVTAGSALTHDLASVEAVEISPEVVEAAALFRHVNRNALGNPRLRLIVGDGRNHLLLTRSAYDVIISEPSNPWMAGVSALFSRDFFLIARERLAPGGLFCQWAHVYNMAEADLRTLVGGFVDVFEDSALFLVNEGDVLLIGARETIRAPTAAELSRRMRRDEVREDLAGVSVKSRYGFASLYALSRAALSEWVRGADRHTDDRPVLEFRAPRSIHANTGRANANRISELARGSTPAEWAAQRGDGSAAELLERATMLERAQSPAWAAEVYLEAISKDAALLSAYEGLVRCGVQAGDAAGTERRLLAMTGAAPVEARVALALLYHSQDRSKEALDQLYAAFERDPGNRRALALGAEIQEQSGHVEAVFGLARTWLRVAPGDPEAEAFLASANLAAGQLEEAANVAKRVLAREPLQSRALEVAAIVAARRGDRAAARGFFERLVAAEPNDAGHLTNFGVFEMEGRDLRAAARLFEMAVSLNPNNAAGYVGLRQAAEGLGDRHLLHRAEANLRRLGSS